jgi:hypothetical protein
MSFNFIGKQRERADHEKSGKGRVTAVRMDRRSEKSEDKRRMLCDAPPADANPGAPRRRYGPTVRMYGGCYTMSPSWGGGTPGGTP